MEKEFNTIEELCEYVDTNIPAEKYIIDIQPLPDNSKFLLRWQEQKYYTAQDGKTYPDEAWLTIDNKLVQIQDIELEHCRNILRMLIRRERNLQEQWKEAVTNFTNLIGEIKEELNQSTDNADSTPKHILH